MEFSVCTARKSNSTVPRSIRKSVPRGEISKMAKITHRTRSVPAE
jgi:hypothetical protein